MLAYFLHDFSPFIVKFGNGFGLRWYGLAYVIAFLLGYKLYSWLSARGYTEMTTEQVGDFITWAAVFGVMIGGRVGWILFYGLKQDHSADPWNWPLQVWKGGMSSHGGILGLVFVTLWFSRRYKLSWTSIGDCLCAVAPIGLFVVRLANFINGELYGKISSAPWAVQFPTELTENAGEAGAFAHRFPELVNHDPDAVEDLVRQSQHGLLNFTAHMPPAVEQAFRDFLPARHPSQIYEAFLEGVVLFLILWIMRTRMRVPRGVITGAFFICYAALRIVGEMFRVPDPAWSVGTFSAGQFLSLFMFLIGAAFIFWGFKTQEYEPCFATDHKPAGEENAEGS